MVYIVSKKQSFQFSISIIRLQKKCIRENEAPFMTKKFHKEITQRSRLRNKYLQAWTNCAPDTDRAHSGAQNL